MRALRVDKLTYAALEATLDSYLCGRSLEEIPALAAFHTNKDTILSRARAFVQRVSLIDGFHFNLSDGGSVIGGGSAPETLLPTTLIGVTNEHLTPDEIEKRLRHNVPPVIVRIVENQVILDLRTVPTEAETELIEAFHRISVH